MAFCIPYSTQLNDLFIIPSLTAVIMSDNPSVMKVMPNVLPAPSVKIHNNPPRTACPIPSARRPVTDHLDQIKYFLSIKFKLKTYQSIGGSSLTSNSPRNPFSSNSLISSL